MTPEFENILTFMILSLMGFLWIKSFKILLRAEFMFGYVQDLFDRLIDWATVNSRSRLKKLFEWIEKPIYRCVFCMSSVHGIIVFSLTKWVNLHSLEWIVLLLYLPILMGVITLYYTDPYDYEIEADEENG